MIQVLLNTPRNPAEWSEWSFHNYLSHLDIDTALQKQKQVTVQSQIIYPIPWDDLYDWLARHQLLHNAEVGPLGLQNYDFQSVDLTDPRQAEAFVWLHWLDHQSKQQALGI